jgi:hypothetical protein
MIEIANTLSYEIILYNIQINNSFEDSRFIKVLFIGTKKELFDEFEDLTDSSIEAIKKAL